MKKSLALSFLLIAISFSAFAQNTATVVCTHKEMNLKAVLSDIQPFSVGAGGEMVDLTSGTLNLNRDGATEVVGTIGRATSKSESYQTDRGTGMNLVWDESGRMTVSLVSRKLNFRVSTSTGLECTDERKESSHRSGPR